MLIVAGTLTVDPADREAMLAAAGPMMEASNAEPGCRTYAFSPDVNDPALVHLFERWDDQAALDAHFASAHMAEWRQVSAGLKILSRDIAKYTISEVGPLP